MLITVSGPPGSGTTTTAEHVAVRLEVDLVPGGEVFRAMAVERAMSLPAFGLYATDHPEVDVELDTRLAVRARAGGVVIESRLAGWIAHNERLAAVAAWIDCDPDVRARRVAEREGVSVVQARADNVERQAVERARYLALYGIDLDDLSIYDLVLDSGLLRPEEISDRIVAAVDKRFS
ncbi:MAG TPA: AAA family ATPase [Acidimicrobiales bacterium]|nr:AAA family ATPase [Acidimicrobiales bacterium]